MKKLAGIFCFLVVLYVVLLSIGPQARGSQNHFNLGQRIGLYGIITLAAGIVIITGNIDLSMGSVVGLVATTLCVLTDSAGFDMNLWVAIPFVLLMGAGIGLIHGLLVTKLGVQSFIVTLCGMFAYRGIARIIGKDAETGPNEQFEALIGFFRGDLFGVPWFLVMLAVVLMVAAVFLHYSVYGRYFFALGSNERAARYSGIPTDGYKIAAFVLCSTLTALYTVVNLLKYNTVQPSSTGQSDELYAIAGAVLGGCSLRGGEGNIFGILIGTCMICVLPNVINMLRIHDSWTPVALGAALLCGAILDEWFRRRGSVRKT